MTIILVEDEQLNEIRWHTDDNCYSFSNSEVRFGRRNRIYMSYTDFHDYLRVELERKTLESIIKERQFSNNIVDEAYFKTTELILRVGHENN